MPALSLLSTEIRTLTLMVGPKRGDIFTLTDTEVDYDSSDKRDGWYSASRDVTVLPRICGDCYGDLPGTATFFCCCQDCRCVHPGICSSRSTSQLATARGCLSEGVPEIIGGFGKDPTVQIPCCGSPRLGPALLHNIGISVTALV